MKSCLGLLFTLLVFTIVLGGGALIWYLSSTSEFSRDQKPPKAIPVRPSATAPARQPTGR